MEKRIAFLIFGAIFLLLGETLQTQKPLAIGDTTGKYHLSPGILVGSIVPHRSSMQNVIKGHSVGCAVQILHRPPHTFWRMDHYQPIDGWDLYFSTTGNPQQLGYQFGLAYIIYRRILPQHIKNWWWGNGLGIGYSTRIWDLKANHQAPILSTHFNAEMILHLQYELLHLQKFNVMSGLRITHLSNGAYQLPNLGTNNVQLTLALQPRMSLPIGNYSYIDILPAYQSSQILSYIGSAGIKETFQPLGKKYGVWNAQLTYAKRINERHRWVVGLDYLYQPALKKLWAEYKGIEATAQQCMQWGMNIGYQTVFGKTWFTIHQGYYLYSPWKDNGKLYHRLSIRRNFDLYNYGMKRAFIYAALFTHFAKADHAEIGIGWDLYRR